MSVSDRLDQASECFVQGVDQSRKGNYAGAIQALQHDLDNAAALVHRCVARY